MSDNIANTKRDPLEENGCYGCIAVGCTVACIGFVVVMANWDTIITFVARPRLWITVVVVAVLGMIDHKVNGPKRRLEAERRKAETDELQRKEQERRRREAEEESARRAAESARRADEQKRHEERFLRYLFSMLAKLAKADGKIDEEEVKTAEKVFDKFEFALRRRRFCSNVFNEAKDNSRSIYWYAEQLGNQTSDVEACIFVYELLWDVACADGWLHPAEKEILQNICGFLHIPQAYYDINYRRCRTNFVEGDKRTARRGPKGTSKREKDWHRPYVSGKSSILEAYELLESESTASLEELKSAYRRLAKRYHPDLLRANGVPEEMIAEANERMAQINVAWEDIRRTRGFM